MYTTALSRDHTGRNIDEVARLRTAKPDDPDVVKRGRVKGYLGMYLSTCAQIQIDIHKYMYLHMYAFAQYTCRHMTYIYISTHMDTTSQCLHFSSFFASSLMKGVYLHAH